MADKEIEDIEEPTMEDLEEDLDESEAPQEEEEKEEVETEKKKAVDDNDEAEGSFMSVDAAEKRNVKSSDLKLDETVEDIQEDEFTCSICFLLLKFTQLAKPRAKVCYDCA